MRKVSNKTMENGEKVWGINVGESGVSVAKKIRGCSCGCIQRRFVLLFMVFLGFMTMYALRVNFNVAIGAMVHNHTVIEDGIAVEKNAEFDWNSKMQGIVLGSLYYGYPVSQLPGGWLSLRFGGTRIFGLGVLMASILTIFTAPAARLSIYALVVLRAAEGLFLGVLAPCNHTIWSKWSHPMERTIMVAVSFSGSSIGTIITMPLTGLLTKYGFGGGWPSVFYCFGGFGVLWFTAWLFIVHECPSDHPGISEQEREYLNSGIGILPEFNVVPWKSIFTSKHVWAIVAANISTDWGLYTILICLPTFLLDILHFDIQAAGFIAALPFLVKVIITPTAGIVSDTLRRNGIPTITVRRLCFGIGSLVSAVSLVIAGYCTSTVAVIFNMCVSVGFTGLLTASYDVNMLDIAPRLACIIMGVSNSIGTFSGFLSPMLVGVITQDKKASEWQTVFWIASGVYVAGAAIFCTFLDDQVQPWATDECNPLHKEVVDVEENKPSSSKNIDTENRATESEPSTKHSQTQCS